MNTERIISLLGEVLDKDESELLNISRTTSLKELGLDSIRFIQFIVAFEEAFDLEVRDSDLLLSNFDTLEALFGTLNKYFDDDDTPSVKKVLVCDCDNVLWHGIAGEEPLQLDNNAVNFQNELIRLRDDGILLCLCSKNEYANINEAFEHLNMPLKKEHIAVFVINRNDKAANIKQIAGELNVGLDSFVFVDDSDYEIGLVESLLPEVEAVKADYSDKAFISKIQCLFNTDASQPMDRTTLYREQKEREKTKLQYTSVAEYNNSLDTNCNCHIAENTEVGRIAELSQRTNQFNLSCRRYSEKEIQVLVLRNDYLILSLSASDKFGDMGLVGASVIRLAENRATIECFFLSCRVFDRDFELVLLNEIKTQCGDREISGIYVKSEKNIRYKDFYFENGVCS